jgi:hypothetical protein
MNTLNELKKSIFSDGKISGEDIKLRYILYADGGIEYTGQPHQNYNDKKLVIYSS